VDTHVGRISVRLGWTKEETPAGVERDLQRLFPKEHWHEINQTLVAFGQTVCRPVAPHCGDCLLREECPSSSAK
ncbi:MAG TPA: endonuclease III, partial [Candidatus Aminicenantes bacterium]|nr:endonuclease III [Candidatus Aminicenantes bacterium]